MKTAEFNDGLRAYLDASPTPYHAVANGCRLLKDAGFEHLSERQPWHLQPGGRYYFTRHDSSLVAFVYGQADPAVNGIRMMGAHTDSPCLKLKPSPQRIVHSYLQLGIEIYGGALLNPWFDRDLSLAGRVSCRRADGTLQHPLVDFRRPVAVIPNLAIHLDREANNNRSINPQEDMRAILLQTENGKMDFRQLLHAEMVEQKLISTEDQVLEFDLSLYDTQPAALVGLREDFLASARLDNLLSCYAGLRTLAAASGEQSALLVLNDHEEVGSVSDVGAQGTLLTALLERLLPEAEQRQRALSGSLFLSVDNAHGIHPNYPRKHDENHGPILNRGPVLKVNANQRYATTSDNAALVRLLAETAGVPLQVFVSRADMACGSTIGPMTAAKLGVSTLDVGVPTFAMHSIRELAGTDDAADLCRLLEVFVAREALL